MDLKKEKNIKENEVFIFIKKNFTPIMISLLFIQTALIVFQVALGLSSLILSSLIGVVLVFGYLMFKEKEDGEYESIRYLQIISLNLIMSIINDSWINLMFNVFGSEVKAFKILIVIDFAIIVLAIALFQQEGVQEIFNNAQKREFLNNLDSSKGEVMNQGDAFLGYHVDEKGKTDKNKPIILPFNDRFLHMLILGPTGCGKTSQTIIPMIYNDIQNPNIGVICLEPKGDLAEKVYAMCKHKDREVLYFNPILPDCPYFNPLFGKESDVVENMATTFNMLNPDSPQFFKDMTDNLIRKAIKLLKRIYNDDATLIDLNTLVWDTNGEGRKMVMQFSKIKSPNPDIQKENEEIYSWVLNDYYSGMSGARGASKTFEHCSGVRSQISKLISNKYLRRVLNPPRGRGSDLDFDDALKRGTVISMGTAQGSLRELGRYLGYFIILQLQASVFRRPGNENTRKGCMLFIDEFQVYSNPGFSDMLTMGRSYRTASHLATQAREQIGMGAGSDGKSFVQLVSTNARNKIIYPGVSFADAKYYSDEFGTALKITESKTYAKKRFLSTLSEERVSTAIKESDEARFSPSDIIFKEFGFISYCIVKKNSVQPPGVSKIQYIPVEVNKLLDEMVAEYNEEQFKKDLEVENMYNGSINRNNFNGDDNMFASSKLENAEIKNINEFTDPISAVSVNTEEEKRSEPIVNNNTYEGNFIKPPIINNIEEPIEDDSIIGEIDIESELSIIGEDLDIPEEFDNLI